jgi:uncharacterized coiled-coil protein SlyX
MALVCIVLLGATATFYSKYKQSAADFVESTAQQDSTRLRYERAVGEIVAIQDSLSAIVLGENVAHLAATSHEVELNPPQTLHDGVLERIALLKGAIERTKTRIEELDARLKKSGLKVAGLEKMIAGLRKSVSEKESRIAELETQVGDLETRVAGLSVEVEDQQLEIAEKRMELATVYYAMGTKKELTSTGILESTGGVLGIGKTLKPTGRFDEARFSALDTDLENVIRIPAEKAQVLSAQPASSYELRPIGKEMVELRILDSEAFRKVKHVVILTT